MNLKNLSLRNQLAALLAVGVLGAVINGLVAVTGTTIMANGIGDIVKTQASVQVQTDIDMMHDAVRGDVLQAILAQIDGDENLAKEASDALGDHSKKMLDLFAANASAVDPALKSEIEPILNRYLASAKDLVAQPLRSAATASQDGTPASFIESPANIAAQAAALAATEAAAQAAAEAASAPAAEASSTAAVTEAVTEAPTTAPTGMPAKTKAQLAAFLQDFEILEGGLEKMTSALARTAEDRHLRASASIKTISAAAILTSILALLSLVGGGWFVYRLIGPPLRRLVTVADQIVSSGDLTLRLQASGNNEISAAMRAVDRLVEAQQAIVQDVRNAADQVNSAVASMNQLCDETQRDASTQRDQVDSVSGHVDGLESSIQQVGSSAQQAQLVASDTGERSRNSASVVLDTASDMNRIAKNVEETARAVASLESEAQAIAAVIATIKGIADQTNLLALNAAIEAARAGEQGRGFAVVADEVRKLAEHTSLATDQISRTIQTVQSTIHEAVGSIDRSVKGVGSGVERAREAGDAVGAIPASAAEVSSAMQDIASAVAHQQESGRVIADLIRSMKESAARNTSNAERVTAVSAGAAASMDALLKSTRRFKV